MMLSFLLFDFYWNGYRIHLLYMNKDEAINLLRNADMTEKGQTL